jgi:hypothetical protein
MADRLHPEVNQIERADQLHDREHLRRALDQRTQPDRHRPDLEDQTELVTDDVEQGRPPPRGEGTAYSEQHARAGHHDDGGGHRRVFDEPVPREHRDQVSEPPGALPSYSAESDERA